MNSSCNTPKKQNKAKSTCNVESKKYAQRPPSATKPKTRTPSKKRKKLTSVEFNKLVSPKKAKIKKEQVANDKDKANKLKQ